MTGPNFSAIRVRLAYESLEDFMQGYTRFISKGGMFIPMSPAKLKPVGTTIRFQFLLQDGTTALLGEGVVRQIQGADSGDNSPVGILVKFTRLNRQSKELVEQILVRKRQAAEAAAPAQEEPPQADRTQEDLDATPVPGVFNLDDEEESEQVAPNTADSDLTLDSLSRSEIMGTDEESDGLFVSADDDAGDESTGGLPLDASGSDIFGDAQEDADASPLAEESDVSEEISEASEEISDASQEAGEAPDTAPEGTPVSANPQRLGRTEAGLEIMAFDRVSEDEAAGLADFDFGSDDGDIDEMFDNVFGDGGFFGGDDDSAQDDAFDFTAPDSDSELIGATAHDGGEPLELSKESSGGEAAQAQQESTEFDGLFASDAATGDSIFPTEDAQTNESALDESASDEDDLMNDDFEFDFDAPDEAEEAGEDEDEGIFASDDALEDEAVFEDADIFEDAESLDEENIFEDAEFLEEEDLLEDAEILDDGFVLEDDDAFENDDTLFEHEADIDSPTEDFVPEDYTPAPSDDLLSVLGSLDSDDDDQEPAQGLTLGSSAGLAAVGAVEEEDEKEEEEDSLASLLALAQQDIDAKRQAEGEEVDNDPDGDIFDQLLGSNDLPAPPENQPMFNIADNEPKKKKGGFMSKFFGKD